MLVIVNSYLAMVILLIGNITNAACEGCTGCSSSVSLWNMPFQELPLLLVALTIGILLFVKRNKGKVLFWTLGLAVFFTLAFSMADAQLQEEVHRQKTETDSLNLVQEEFAFFDEGDAVDSDSELLGNEELSEFESVGTFDEFNDDEFSDTDEFGEFNSTDKFEEFSEFDEFSDLEESETQGISHSKLIRILIALFAAIVAGVLVRFENGRKFKSLILLVSLVYHGFYSGGCPCMISSFQNLLLFLMGEPTDFINLIWILGLIPITYFFGKVWCGWVCHLGALQEFLYRPGIAKNMNTPKMQRILKMVRIVAFFALIFQLLLTRTNLFIKIDPFKVVFNLFSVNLTGYVLLVVLLISSLFIYRPFCKSICPVGLVLGWIEKIPGASRLVIQPSCKKCSKCVRKCDYQAISNNDGLFVIDNSECIRCGDCLDGCNDIKIESLKWR